MKMDKFRENKEIEAECFMISDPLYSHFGGYKMCLGWMLMVSAKAGIRICEF